MQSSEVATYIEWVHIAVDVHVRILAMRGNIIRCVI